MRIDPDPDMFGLINYNPWIMEKRAKYDDDAVLCYVKKHLRSVIRGTFNTFPLNQIISLGASMQTIKKISKHTHPLCMNRIPSIKLSCIPHVIIRRTARNKLSNFYWHTLPKASNEQTRTHFCRSIIPAPPPFPVPQLFQSFNFWSKLIHKQYHKSTNWEKHLWKQHNAIQIVAMKLFSI